MKLYIYLTIIIFSFFFLRSPLFAQPVNNFAEDVVAPTPQAAALGAYIDVPVSHVTGTPQISIPICAVADGPLSLPINLSYHASGIKSTQYASWCGLGWSTTQFMVTRMVQGLPDTHSGGYYSYGSGMTYYEDFPGSYVSSCNPPDPELPNYNTLGGIASNTKDGESDLYSFSLPGGFSGKFVIDNNQDIHLIPRQDIQIDIHHDGSIFDRILITTPDGVQHHFGATPTGNEAAYDNQSIGNGSTYIINWHLVQSNTYDGLYNINYSYLDESYSYDTPKTCSEDYVYGSNFGGGGGNSTFLTSCPTSTTVSTISGKKLHKIITTTDTVTFTADINREDFATAATGDALSNIEIKTGEFCKYFSLDYDYFTDGIPGTDPLKKKLKLESVQEFSCDNTESIPAHTFDYHGIVQSNGNIYVPGVTSKNIDHWGYANGASNNLFNIPETTLTSCSNIAVTAGGADRDVDTAVVKTATLKRINYPTGGYSNFDFESHTAQYYSSSANPMFKFFHSSCGTLTGCCGPQTSSTTKSFTAQELLGNVLFDFEVARTPPGTPCTNSPVDGKFEILENNVVIGELGFNLDLSESIKKFVKANLSQVLFGATFNSTSSYTFRVSSTNGKASLWVFTTTAGLTEDYVGGLRIKRISHHDGIDDARDIIMDYEYQEENNNAVSSGILLDLPTYGYSYLGNPGPAGGVGGNATCLLHFSSSPVVALSDFEGAHISYKHVKEIFKDNGYNTYKFKVEYDTDYFESIGGKFMSIPIPFDNSKGFKLEQKTFKQGGGSSIASTLSTFKSEPTSIIPGINIRARKAYCGNPSFAHMYWRAYQNKTSRRVRLESQNSTLDGVTTESLITYDPQDRIAAPIVQSMTNSDNRQYDTEYSYPHDSTASVYQDMVDLNIITPISTIQRVRPTTTTDTIIDVSTIQYDHFTTLNGSFPYPSVYMRSEVTWDPSYSITDDVTQATINAYDNEAGKPSSITIDGWKPYTYTYNDAGLRTSEIFETFTKTYSYYNNTRLLNTITNVDNTSMSYTYDKLLRLKTTTDNCRNVTTTLDYNYGAPDGGNFIKTTTDYLKVDHSDLDLIVNRNYIDGLGRSIQQIKEDQGANSTQDVVTAIVYDNRGRVSKQYEPEGVDDNDGDFITSVNWPYATTTYEPSPLNRPTATTHSAWNHPSTIVYGKNSSAINGISTNQLFKKTIIDPDLRESITYTDKKGRTVATVAAGSGGVGKLTTNYHYDDKDRVTMIRPPSVNASSSELIFTYEYYANDLVKFKKVPDAEVVEYRYNNRDLMIAYQDGYLRSQSSLKWLSYNYDDYGRQKKSGFTTTGHTNNNPTTVSTPTITETNKLSQTNYFATTHVHKDKPQLFYWRELLPQGGLGKLRLRQFTYDACGRTRLNRSSSILSPNNSSSSRNQNRHVYSYDGADNMLIDDHSQAFFGTYDFDVTRTIDSAGRLDQVTQKFTGLTDQIVSQYRYTPKSQIAQHRIGKTPSSYLQICNYDYYDNMYLKSINQILTSTSEDLFHLDLKYTDPLTSSGGIAQKNGNISQVLSQVKGDANRKSFGYRYDSYNRLTYAYSRQFNSSGTFVTANRYNTQYTYDSRGNIATLKRKGRYPVNGVMSTGQIDNLTMTPVSGMNRISTVVDNGTSPQKRRGAKGGGTTVYAYDDNGNITFDPTRDATTTYNHLNLPSRIDFGSGRFIDFTYSSEGTLLRKEVKQGLESLEDRHYIDGAEYKDSQLVQLMHDAGRIARTEPCDQNQFIGGVLDDAHIYHGDNIISNSSVVPTGLTEFKADQSITLNEFFEVKVGKTFEAEIVDCPTTPWQYEYVLKDHLGNTRVVFTADGTTPKILQESNYYPFGMEMEGEWQGKDKNDYNYGYNGKEIHKDFDWGLSNFGFRYYDPSIGRFTGVDPISDQFPHVSTYNYAENEPIASIDLWGLQKLSIHSRSFAPFDQFGQVGPFGPFEGDGHDRGFSTSESSSSRISASIPLNLSSSGASLNGNVIPTGSNSHSLRTGRNRFSDADIEGAFYNSKGGSSSSLAFHLFGNNEVIRASPDIDVHGYLNFNVADLSDGGSTVTIDGSIYGDRFPNNETFLTDKSNQSVFLNVFATEYGPNVGPAIGLVGDAKRQMGQIESMTIRFDADGKIMNISSGGKTYSIESWNALFQESNEIRP